MSARTRLGALLVGASIALAACGGSAATPSPSPSAAPAGTPAPTEEPAPTIAAPTEAPSDAASPAVTVYRVRKGDTLWSIHLRFKVKLAALIAANPQLADPDKLTIGDRINIPGAAGPSPSA